MSNNKNLKTFSTGFATIAIPIIFVVAILTFVFVLGNASNFKDVLKEKPVNALGIVHSGGIIVPILMSLLLMVITFVVERALTLFTAKGWKVWEILVTVFLGGVWGIIISTRRTRQFNNYIATIYRMLSKGEIEQAIKVCDEQKGSVANVVRAGLNKYAEMSKANDLNKDQKIVAIKAEFEEATSLELPMLEQNLVILATISSIATLMGLLGTVLGMIKSFSAMAQEGAPDAVKLASGISEALINTALGIGTSAIAIIAYNFFTTQIDKMTYSIDEAGVAITQNFASRYN